jgi:hypothetical protein
VLQFVRLRALAERADVVRRGLHSQLAVQFGVLRRTHGRHGCVQHAELDVDLPVSPSRTQLTGAAVVMVIATAALVEVLLQEVPSAPPETTMPSDLSETVPTSTTAFVARSERRTVVTRAVKPRPVAAPTPGAVSAFSDPEPVQRAGAVAPPSLVHLTPRVKADRIDVWAAFPKLDRASQLALQDSLPPDPSGPRLERSAGVVRLVAPPTEGETVFWVSEGSGYLGTGESVEAPDRDDSVRAVFVGRGVDGSVQVSSSPTLEMIRRR